MKNKDQLPDKPVSEKGICIRNQQVFSERIRRLNALACTNIKREDFDIEKEMEKSECALEALNARDSLQQNAGGTNAFHPSFTPNVHGTRQWFRPH